MAEGCFDSCEFESAAIQCSVLFAPSGSSCSSGPACLVQELVEKYVDQVARIEAAVTRADDMVLNMTSNELLAAAVQVNTLYSHYLPHHVRASNSVCFIAGDANSTAML